jgi:hypothetical protein
LNFLLKNYFCVIGLTRNFLYAYISIYLRSNQSFYIGGVT